MFKVPADPHAPSYDRTITIGFWQWFTSSKADRQEWKVRGDIANRLRAEQAKAARNAKYEPRLAELRARAAEIRAEINAKVAGRRR